MKRNNNTYEPPKHPDLVHVIKAALDLLRVNLRVAVPGKIVKYDAALQLADVEVQFIPILFQDEKPGSIIIAPNIPVVFPRTNTGYITFPIQTGDTGQLIVNDRALEKWLEFGVPVDPQWPATHRLTDAAFYPGMHAKNNPITPATSLTSTVVEGPTIQFGVNAAQGVARLGDEVTLSAGFSTWLNNLAAAVPFAPYGAPVKGTITSSSNKVLSE